MMTLQSNRTMTKTIFLFKNFLKFKTTTIDNASTGHFMDSTDQITNEGSWVRLTMSEKGFSCPSLGNSLTCYVYLQRKLQCIWNTNGLGIICHGDICWLGFFSKARLLYNLFLNIHLLKFIVFNIQPSLYIKHDCGLHIFIHALYQLKEVLY